MRTLELHLTGPDGYTNPASWVSVDEADVPPLTDWIVSTLAPSVATKKPGWALTLEPLDANVWDAFGPRQIALGKKLRTLAQAKAFLMGALSAIEYNY